MLHEKAITMLTKRMRKSQHQDHSIVNVEEGEFIFNCSGLVNYLLRESLPAFIEFWSHTGESPQVLDYCSRIESLDEKPSPHWLRIHKVTDMAPGDLLVWKRPRFEGEYGKYPDGHAMVIADFPSPSWREGEMLVTVVDSTKQPHLEDTREKDKLTGLGLGTVGLGVNPDGTPKSYWWRGGISEKEITTWVGAARLIERETS